MLQAVDAVNHPPRDKLNFVPASVFLNAALKLNGIGDLTMG